METRILETLILETKKDLKKDINDLKKAVEKLVQEKHERKGAKHIVTVLISAFVAVASTIISIYFGH